MKPRRARCISAGCRRLVVPTAQVSRWGRCREHRQRMAVTLTLATLVRRGEAVVTVGPDGGRRYGLAGSSS